MTYFSTVLADSPTLLWELQETSGTTAVDSSGNANTGTYQAGAYTQGVTGPPGVAPYAVSGTSGSLCPVYSSGSITPAASCSFECWVKTTSTLGGVIIETASYNAVVYMLNSGIVWFTVNDGSFATAASSTALNDGSWHHIAGVYNSSGPSVALYVDGSLAQSSSAGTWTHGSNAIELGGQLLSGYPGTWTNTSLIGTFCAAALYPAALSATQVSNHYAAASAAPAKPSIFPGRQQAVVTAATR